MFVAALLSTQITREVVTLSITPELIRGVNYVAATGAGAVFDSDVQWIQATRTVRFRKQGHVAEYQVGKEQAQVDGKRVPMGWPVYIREGSAMVPLRLLAGHLGVSLGYDKETDSFLVPNSSGIRVVPMPSRREGFVVFEPTPLSIAAKRIRVRGQANLLAGELVAQFHGRDGEILDEIPIRATSGHFGEFVLDFIRAKAGGGEERVDVVVMLRDPEGKVVSRKTVPVRLRLSDG